MATKRIRAAGYAGTPLGKKLGIKEGFRIAFLRAPPQLAEMVAPLPRLVSLLRAARPPMDLVLLFTKSRADLEKRLPALRASLTTAGMLWVAWPKKSSGVPTDLSFDAVQTAGLAAGLVDVKICAVDETWSGLKFVIRRKDRPALHK